MTFKDRVQTVVWMIPPGKVATYGQIASLAGRAGAARACGQVMRHCDDDFPWHRVINAQGRVSPGADPERPRFQRSLLEAEGVVFTPAGRCNLDLFRWNGPESHLDWE